MTQKPKLETVVTELVKIDQAQIIWMLKNAGIDACYGSTVEFVSVSGNRFEFGHVEVKKVS